MTKLESPISSKGAFTATMFYPTSKATTDRTSGAAGPGGTAFFSTEVRVLGTYPASPFRAELKLRQADATERAA